MSYNTRNAFITCAAVSVLLLILAGPIHQVQGLPNGAPTAACGSMSPTAGHSVNPQQSSAPYVTTVSDQTNTAVTLNLRPNNDQNSFKGYLVMAFDVNDENTAIGTFEQPSNGKLMSCGSGSMNAATHSDASTKNSVTLKWTPPPNYSGRVIFRTTFVKEKTIFWVKSESQTVTFTAPSTTTAPVTPKKNSAPSQFVSVTCGNLIFLSLLIFLVR
ncbi:hypothetical protein DAPPUDRAFT_304086 [Daphnia pulex]|uniref:Reelin domain-containing protein n=1 Tax=Daphnia pulex TaxID=6669 RepID=E9GJ02_DAPPU|nr:hypothetical protein DAPPUDRAFT_304086 [Daphnia pulex]|eukprot:EFX80568.1 hypothetical protein DAPPUDRAFT_304086 [Daphnia pulex]